MWKMIEKILDITLFVLYATIIIYDIWDGRPDAALAWICCAYWHLRDTINRINRRNNDKRAD